MMVEFNSLTLFSEFHTEDGQSLITYGMTKEVVDLKDVCSIIRPVGAFEVNDSDIKMIDGDKATFVQTYSGGRSVLLITYDKFMKVFRKVVDVKTVEQMMLSN
jgi:hypothetical protein